MPMTANERVRLAFQHEEADRVPIYGECRNIPFIEAMAGRKLSGSQEEMEAITARAYARAGIDLIRRLLTPQWGIEKGDEFDIQWDGYLNWKVGGERRLSPDEAAETLRRRWLDGPGDPRRAAVAVVDEVRRIQTILGEHTLFMPTGFSLGIEGMYHTIGIENFSILMYERPDLIDDVLESAMLRAVARAGVVNEIYDGPLLHGGDDLGMKGATLVSPAWLREHYFPRMKRIVAAAKSAGKLFSFHTCGNVTEVLPDLVDTGIDALNPLEVTAGMDLAQVKADYGDRLVVIGNANANIVQMGTPDDVRAEVRRCLDDAANGGGYFLCGGRTASAPVENLIAYFDEARSYQGWRRVRRPDSS